MHPEITISIKFLLVGQSAWQQADFLPESFFDLDPGEAPEIDSVPKRNHAIEYLEVDPGHIQHTILTITNTKKETSKVVSETFWNGGRNRIIETNEIGVAEPHTELIVETKVNQQPPVTEIVRAWKEKGPWALAYHVFILTNPDGTETEKKVYPPESQ